MKNWKRLGGMALALLLLLPGCGTPPPEQTETPEVTPGPVSSAPSMAPIPTPSVSAVEAPGSVPPVETLPVETSAMDASPAPEASGVLPGGIYTRRYEEYTDRLIPAEDYGPLVPYLGDETGPYLEDGLWGLATLKGELVTDPVFTQIWRGGGTVQLPYILLKKPDPDPEYRPAGWVNGEYDFGMTHDSLWAMAALDGSWCTDFRYRVYHELVNWGILEFPGSCQCDERGLFVRDAFDDSLVYLSGETGEELLRIGDIPIEEYDARWENGLLWGHYRSEENQYVGVMINTETGRRLIGENLLFEGVGDGLITTYARSLWRYGYVDLETAEWVLPATYGEAEAFQNGVALVNLRDEEGYSLGDAVIDRQGNILVRGPCLKRYGNQLWSMERLYKEEKDWRVMAIYDADTLQPIDSPYAGQEFYWHFSNYGPDRFWNENVEEFWAGSRGISLSEPEENMIYSLDYVTGEPYTWKKAEDGTLSFCSPDGTLLLEYTPPGEDCYVTLAGGLLLVGGEEEPYARVHEGEKPQHTALPVSRYTGIMTPEGEWVFRYPYQALTESFENE